MDKKLKILIILNTLSYIFVSVLAVVLINGTYKNFNNTAKFIIGIVPFIFIASTSFVLAGDRFIEFKAIRMEAIIDWTLRTIVLEVIVNYSERINSIIIVLMCAGLAFIVNSAIEYKMNKKVMSAKGKPISEDRTEITYEEKCNLKHMVKAVNSSSISIFIFIAFSLSVPVMKNMEGTETRWYMPVILSVVVYAMFLNSTYHNYMGFYLDKKHAKNLYIRDMTFASIGYILCLALTFIKFNYNTYSYITLGGIVTLLPRISTLRKMSLRVKKIKDSLDKDSYYTFMSK